MVLGKAQGQSRWKVAVERKTLSNSSFTMAEIKRGLSNNFENLNTERPLEALMSKRLPHSRYLINISPRPQNLGSEGPSLGGQPFWRHGPKA